MYIFYKQQSNIFIPVCPRLYEVFTVTVVKTSLLCSQHWTRGTEQCITENKLVQAHLSHTNHL